MNKSARHIKGLSEVSICARNLAELVKINREGVGLEVPRRDERFVFVIVIQSGQACYRG